MVKYCEFCKKEIDEYNLYGKGRFCNKKCQLASISKKGAAAAGKSKHEKYEQKLQVKQCLNCGKEFKTITGKFCSRVCARKYSGNKSHVFSDETKFKIKNGMISYYKSHPDAKGFLSKKAQENYNKKAGLDKPIYEYKDRQCSRCGSKISVRNKTGLC